jgi:hypothetical protein
MISFLKDILGMDVLHLTLLLTGYTAKSGGCLPSFVFDILSSSSWQAKFNVCACSLAELHT